MDAHSAPIGSPKQPKRHAAAGKPISRPTTGASARKRVPSSVPKVERDSEPDTSKERTRPIRVEVDTGLARTESFRRVAMSQASQLRLGMRWYQALTNVIHPLLCILGMIIAWHVGTGHMWETGTLTAAIMYRVNPRLCFVDILFTPPIIIGALLHAITFVSLRRMRRRAPLASVVACVFLPLMWVLHDIWQSIAIGGRVGIWIPLALLVACATMSVFNWQYLQRRKALFVH